MSLKKSKFLLEAFDKLFSLVILPPFIIGYWRGTYNLLDIFLYKNNHEIRSWIFIIIGIIGNFFLTFYQRQIKLFLNPEINQIRYLIGSRIYTIISSIICINGFRSVWLLIEIYITSNIKEMMIILIFVVLILLGAFKGIRNILDTPYYLVRDCYEHFFDIPTRFKMSVKKSENPILWILDSLISVILVPLPVIFWKCTLILLDIILIPEEPILSLWLSLVIGYSITGFIFLIQPVFVRLCNRLEGFWRIFFVDLFNILCIIGQLNIWRAYWGFLEIFFIPG